MSACLVSISGQTDESTHHFQQANQYYLNEDYQHALESYQQILQSGYESAELYYNMGNAYYKLNKIPSAILYYEKALVLKPNDEDIRFNLSLANQLTTDKIETLPQFFISRWYRSLTGLLDEKGWSWISIAAFLLFMISLMFLLQNRSYRFRKIFFTGTVMFFIIALFSFTSARKQFLRRIHPQYAIIFAPSITTKSTPDEGGTDLFILHEGTKVHIEDQIGNWIEIKMADGNSGWIPEKTLRVI